MLEGSGRKRSPREQKTYRWWLRNNAIKWFGASTSVTKQPELVKKISERGEVHYVNRKTG